MTLPCPRVQTQTLRHRHLHDALQHLFQRQELRDAARHQFRLRPVRDSERCLEDICSRRIQETRLGEGCFLRGQWLRGVRGRRKGHVRAEEEERGGDVREAVAGDEVGRHVAFQNFRSGSPSFE